MYQKRNDNRLSNILEPKKDFKAIVLGEEN